MRARLYVHAYGGSFMLQLRGYGEDTARIENRLRSAAETMREMSRQRESRSNSLRENASNFARLGLFCEPARGIIRSAVIRRLDYFYGSQVGELHAIRYAPGRAENTLASWKLGVFAALGDFSDKRRFGG
jgi:hypothetical protein